MAPAWAPASPPSFLALPRKPGVDVRATPTRRELRWRLIGLQSPTGGERAPRTFSPIKERAGGGGRRCIFACDASWPSASERPSARRGPNPKALDGHVDLALRWRVPTRLRWQSCRSWAVRRTQVLSACGRPVGRWRWRCDPPRWRQTHTLRSLPSPSPTNVMRKPNPQSIET